MFRNTDTTLRNFTTTIFNLDRQIDKLMYDRQMDRTYIDGQHYGQIERKTEGWIDE